MTATQNRMMKLLYGYDVWDGFRPIDVDGVQGWNGDHPSLSHLASIEGCNVVADVGVWKGMSTINMALAMKKNNIDGVVISIDTFLGSPEHWRAGGELFERRNGLPNLYQIFMSNVMAAGISDYIVPLPQTSTTAAAILRNLGVKLSIAHIDAAHEYEEVIRDAEEYWSIIEPNGYLIGDDYHETWPGVVKGAAEFSFKHARPLTISSPKWIVQKGA